MAHTETLALQNKVSTLGRKQTQKVKDLITISYNMNWR